MAILYRIKKISFKTVIIWMILSAVFLFAIVPITDGDTGYHLKTGQYIVEHKTVPLYDIFTYTAQGARWVAHYWLSDVFFYLVYLLSGMWGLILFVALIAAFTYWILYKAGRLNGISRTAMSIVLGLFAAFLIKIWSEWVVRPQIFGFLMAAVLIYILEKWRLTKKRKFLICSIPILISWANLHASVVLGIAILGLYVGLSVLRNLRKFSVWKFDAFIGIAAVFSTLLNPNGYRVLIYSYTIAPAVKLVGIFEWRSIIEYLGPNGSPKAPYVFGFMCLAVAVVLWQLLISFKESKRDFNWEWLFLTVAAFILPIISVRHVELFPIMGFLGIAWSVDRIISKYISAHKFERILSAALVILGVVLIISGISGIPSQALGISQLPEGAAEFILKNKLSEPIFNTISQGSYLIWKLWPEYKVFIDGRSEVFPLDVWKEFNTVDEFGVGWKDVFDKYKFNTIVLTGTVPKPGDKLVGAELILAYTLTQKYDYSLVYWDDASLVIVKNNPLNAGIIKKFGYSVIGPYITPQLIPQSQAVAAAKEIQRAMEISPDSQNLKIYLQSFLDYHQKIDLLSY